VENIFINSYTLHECTHRCITFSVTAHPDDGQARPKYVGATDWENIYHLCILLIFIRNDLPKFTYSRIYHCENLNLACGTKIFVGLSYFQNILIHFSVILYVMFAGSWNHWSERDVKEGNTDRFIWHGYVVSKMLIHGEHDANIFQTWPY
jgi:hypothetical protein